MISRQEGAECKEACAGPYRKKRTEWKILLVGNDQGQQDPHTIAVQIRDMQWNDVIFRHLNECWRLSLDRKEPLAAQNPLLWQFAVPSYVAMQSLMITRLTERVAKRSERRFVLLQRALDDIQQHRNLFIREN